MDTDASNTGVGAVLSQVQAGEEKVIAYASRCLTKAERRYSVTRKELLAVVTFIHYFRHYLLGKQFMLHTDHNSLKWLQSFKEPEGQVAWWLECLQEFSFDIQHHKGKLHGNADPLSRYPEVVKDDEQDLATVSAENAEPLLAAVSALPVLLERSPAEIRKLQLDDDVLGPIAVAVETKQKPNISQQKSREYGLLLQQWDRLYVQDGLLFRDYQDTKGNHKWAQLLVPKALQEEVVSLLHGGVASGHLGKKKQ